MHNVTTTTNRLRIFMRSALLVPACLMAAGFSQFSMAKGLTLDAAQLAAMGMETAAARSVDLIPSAVFPAQATLPLQTIRVLSSPLSGQIIKLNYVHGLIKQGDVIAEIESPELLQMQEAFLANLSDLSISQQNFNRARKLNKSGISSTKKLQQASTSVKKLKLKKAQLERNLKLFGMGDTAIQALEKTHTLQPANLQIKAPIDGQLFDLQVRLGERVAKNQMLISLGETDPMILVVRVPVAMANDISDGQKIEILDSDRSGVVKHIDMMVDPMTQSVDVHIKVHNEDNKLRSGQLFKIRFLTEKKRTTYQIPANAISQYDGQTVVFVEQNKTILPMPIQVVNITDKKLYFIPKTEHTAPLNIYIKGSTAIKAAMDAANDSESE